MILLNLAFRPRGALFLWCKWIRADMFCIFLSLTFSKPHNFNTEAARRPFLRPVFMHLRSFLCAHISTCAARPATNAHVRTPRCVPPEARRCALRAALRLPGIVRARRRVRRAHRPIRIARPLSRNRSPAQPPLPNALLPPRPCAQKRPGDPVAWAKRLLAVSRAFQYSRP